MTKEEKIELLEKEKAYMLSHGGDRQAIALGAAIKALEQEQKTGHWILADEQNKEDVENDNYRFICSECRCSDIHAKGTIVPYCWKCGIRMIEPQEKESKE